MLFAGSNWHPWMRSLIIGFLASVFAPGVQWLWIWWWMPADAPHGMGMISAWTYLLMLTVPFMTLVALGAGRFVQSRRAASPPPETSHQPVPLAEATGYGAVIVGSLLLLTMILPGGLALQATSEAIFWGAAFIAPLLVWISVFSQTPRWDFPGMALVTVACPVVIMLVSIAWWRGEIANTFERAFWLPGHVVYLGWTNLLESGPVVVPMFVIATLGYRKLVLRRRLKGNRLTVESARDSFSP